MKGIVILLFVVYAAVGRAQNTMLVDECPKEQEIDWTIELLLGHEDCNKFYKCTFGKPIEYICPADLWFDLETQQCDWRHIVDCTDRNVPEDDPSTTSSTTVRTTLAPTIPTSTTTTTTPAPTAPPTTTPTTAAPESFLPNGCPTNLEIHWLVPHESDCNLFYYCVWGELVQMGCPSTLHFNKVLQVCDDPRSAGCSDS